MKIIIGPWSGPARTPDLTLLDCLLWGYIKNQLYATADHTIKDLEERVRAAFRSLHGQHMNYPVR